MEILTFVSKPKAAFHRWALAPALASAFFLLGAGCDGGREGDRCNPDLSHNDCNEPLTCQQPATCAENYCCPVNASSSTNPYCNGKGCPEEDAGSTASGDAATE